MSAAARFVFRQLSPAGPKAKLSTLIFHRVHEQPDPMYPGDPDARQFARICDWVKSAFNVLPLPKAIAALRAGTLPERAAAITFDDGYADNLHVAAPILKERGLSATFFIATGFLGGGRMWNDDIYDACRLWPGATLDLTPGLPQVPMLQFGQRDDYEKRRNAAQTVTGLVKYLPHADRQRICREIADHSGLPSHSSLMMTPGEVRALRDTGMVIGAHTRTHPILAGLDSAEAEQEIAGSKQDLEQLLGEAVEVFAYPNGKPVTDLTAETVEIVKKAGFASAVTTQWGVGSAKSSCFELPRFTPWDVKRTKFMLRMASNLSSQY
jgi:peptidoglycan/xylan/chitin deacetylase (PgdA/CDA1 family)